MILLDIATFLGHLHPLVVHLPIGFLLLAVLFNLAAYSQKLGHLRAAVPFTLLLGFASAVFACVFGYLLSLSGDYDDDLLSNHRIAGISLAIGSGILYLLTTRFFGRLFRVPAPLFSFLLIALLVLISYTGHQGGSLTHGRDYLALETLTRQQGDSSVAGAGGRDGASKGPTRPKPATVQSALIFEDVVHPMLEKKCGKCHDGGKTKGKLSIHDWQTLLKGGKTGPAVVAGKPGESELIKRISLDPHDEKFMPTDGKTPLTPQEGAILRWWIEKALAVQGKTFAEIKEQETIAPQVAAWLHLGTASPAGASGVGTADTTRPLQHINPDIPATLDIALVENLRKKGLMVRILLQNPVMLDVTLPPGSGKKMNEFREDLKKVAPNIVWLNLSDNGFTEKDLDFLKLLRNLEKLRLEKNPITDGIGDDLLSLRHLEAVNLNETRISSACLRKLAKNPGLKRIYTWKTAVKQSS